MRGDAPGHASRARSEPEITAIHECNLVFVDIGKTQQTAFLSFLGARQASAADDTGNGTVEHTVQHYEHEKTSSRNHERSSLGNFCGTNSRGRTISTSGIVSASTLLLRTLIVFCGLYFTAPACWRRLAPPPGKCRRRSTLCQTLYLCAAWRAEDRKGDSRARNSSARPRSGADEEPLVSCRRTQRLFPGNTTSPGQVRWACWFPLPAPSGPDPR